MTTTNDYASGYNPCAWSEDDPLACYLEGSVTIVFFIGVAVIAILSFIVILLLITICCICSRYRKRKSIDIHREIISEMEGDALQMADVGEGLGTGEIPGKTNENIIKDASLEEDRTIEQFAERMYETVECSQYQKSASNQANQSSCVDTVTDGDNYDIITHNIDGDKSASQNNESGEPTDQVAAKKGEAEKKAVEEKAIVEVEYSVPDMARIKKKQQTTVECNATTVEQVVPQPTLSEYSVIGQQDGRQGGSPPEEPPPLPPPYVDEENDPSFDLQFDIAAASMEKKNSSVEVKHLQGGDLGGLYGNTSICTPDYDNPDSLIASEPQQELYMNVVKR